MLPKEKDRLQTERLYIHNPVIYLLKSSAFDLRHQQFDIDIIQRSLLVDASKGGKVIFEIELGNEYLGGGGIKSCSWLKESVAKYISPNSTANDKRRRLFIATESLVFQTALSTVKRRFLVRAS